MSLVYATQNSLLLESLIKFYSANNKNLERIIPIINGNPRFPCVSRLMPLIIRKELTILEFKDKRGKMKRFKVYNDYKLQLKAHSKNVLTLLQVGSSFYKMTLIFRHIGQHFFKWLLENNIVDDIEDNWKISRRYE